MQNTHHQGAAEPVMLGPAFQTWGSLKKLHDKSRNHPDPDTFLHLIFYGRVRNGGGRRSAHPGGQAEAEGGGAEGPVIFKIRVEIEILAHEDADQVEDAAVAALAGGPVESGRVAFGACVCKKKTCVSVNLCCRTCKRVTPVMSDSQHEVLFSCVFSLTSHA